MEPWICDMCGESIVRAERGWVEWIKTPVGGDRYHGHGLRLVHHTGRNGCQYDGPALFTADGSLLSDLGLEHFLGPDGLMHLLSMLHNAEVVADEVLEMIKRLHIPHYEQARRFIDRAATEGFVEPNTAPRFLSQHQLKAIADKEWS